MQKLILLTLNLFFIFSGTFSQGSFELVKDANVGSQDAHPRDLLVAEDKVYFLTEKNANTGNLWLTNSAANDATLLLEFSFPLVLGAALNYEITHQGILYFTLDETTFSETIWVTDGTSEGTKELERPEGGNFMGLQYFFVLNNEVYFLNFENHLELWKTDGSVVGTTLVKSFCAFQLGGDCYAQSMLNNTVTILNGEAYLFLKTPEYGTELWITDGSIAGTRVIDFIPGAGDFIFDYQRSIAFNDKVYFQCSNGNANLNSANNTGDELYQTDGTLGNTELFLDINKTNGSLANYFGLHSRVHDLFTDGNKLYFFAIDGVTGDELYISDGTPNGTNLLGDILPGNTERGVVPDFYAFNDKVLFNYTTGNWNNQNGVPSTQLWSSNGTVGGTQILKTFNTPFTPFSPEMEFNNLLFFKAKTFENGREIWKTDGTTNSTVRLKNINPGSGDDINANSPIVVLNDLMYFFAFDGSNYALWQSDGTESGTQKVTIPAGNVVLQVLPEELVVLNDKLLFGANIDDSGTEVWSYTPEISTSIFENNLAIEVLYNPLNQSLTISSATLKSESITLQVADVSGRIVLNQKIDLNGSATVKLPELAKQLLLVSLTSKNGIFTKKIML
jgi:ELWxxDGT repeat protein